jgi:hypothetical protein
MLAQQTGFQPGTFAGSGSKLKSLLMAIDCAPPGQSFDQPDPDEVEADPAAIATLAVSAAITGIPLALDPITPAECKTEFRLVT